MNYIKLNVWMRQENKNLAYLFFYIFYCYTSYFYRYTNMC